MLSNRGFKEMDGDWFNIQDRKGFSVEVVRDINNPLVRDWVRRMISEPPPEDEFWFFVMKFESHVDGPTREFQMLARAIHLGAKVTRARIRSFVQ